MRCTQATLEALGIFGKCPYYGTGVIQAIQESGLKWKIVDLPTNRRMTVQRFVKENPIGEFYITTKGHAMALVNGKLTDTTHRGPDKRWIQVVAQIVRDGSNTSIRKTIVVKDW
jgi:hypothetical protein